MQPPILSRPPSRILRPSIVSGVFNKAGCAHVGRFQFFHPGYPIAVVLDLFATNQAAVEVLRPFFRNSSKSALTSSWCVAVRPCGLPG